MTQQGSQLCSSIPAKSLFQPITGPVLHDTSRLMDAICGQGDCLHLRAQQRVPIPPAGKIIILREGVLAVDAMPIAGKLQVLDFLEPGDVVSASTILPTSKVSLRAITNASLVCLDPPAADSAPLAYEYWTFLVSRCLTQLARVNIHQLMIGRLETEPRVASFILGLALKSRRKQASSSLVALPMSRTDIANHLVINCDTLSRTMMKLFESGLIRRESRHEIRVMNLDALRRKSPLASLLSAVFEDDEKQNSTVVHCGAGVLPITSACHRNVDAPKAARMAQTLPAARMSSHQNWPTTQAAE